MSLTHRGAVRPGVTTIADALRKAEPRQCQRCMAWFKPEAVRQRKCAQCGGRPAAKVVTGPPVEAVGRYGIGPPGSTGRVRSVVSVSEEECPVRAAFVEKILARLEGRAGDEARQL